MRSALLTTAVFLGCTLAPDAATAQSGAVRLTGRCADHAPEAAHRSGLSINVIARVMRAESAGSPRALSHKGAMGCMQIMPGTWTYLTRRHGLGADPWNPRMNMIGGALYLAEMVAQFGLPGAYSAYNAGPGRYRRHIAEGVPLPAETIAYTAQLSGTAPARASMPAAPRWQDAGLFVAHVGMPGSDAPRAEDRREAVATRTPDAAARSAHPLLPLSSRVRAAIGTEE